MIFGDWSFARSKGQTINPKLLWIAFHLMGLLQPSTRALRFAFRQDNYTSAALAKAAMLMPVSMDLYSVFKDWADLIVGHVMFFWCGRILDILDGDVIFLYLCLATLSCGGQISLSLFRSLTLPNTWLDCGGASSQWSPCLCWWHARACTSYLGWTWKHALKLFVRMHDWPYIGIEGSDVVERYRTGTWIV